MSQLICTDETFDGMSWEIRFPDDWACWQDFTSRNPPYVFDSSYGSQLTVRVHRLIVEKGSGNLEEVSVELEPYRFWYLQTLESARYYRRESLRKRGTAALRRALGQEPEITKHELGTLVGFEYQLPTEFGHSWIGCFHADPWTLYVMFSSNADSFETDSAAAHSILETFLFFGPSAGSGADATK